MKRRILYTVLFIVVLLACDRIIGLCLNKGLSTYFGLDQHSEVLFIGHSHLMLAVDKTDFENRTNTTVSKYCREGVNVSDRYQMVRQFLSLPESDSLRYVIYGVDQFMFTGEGLSDNSYKLFYPFMDNQVMNDYIRSSTDFKDYFLHKVLCTTRYSDALLNSAARGWMHNWSNYKFGNLDVDNLAEQVAADKQRHIKFEEELIGYFEQTLEMLEDRGLTVILVNTPIARPLNDYEPEKYLLVVNAANIEKDWNWCVAHNTEGAELENASDRMAQLAVQGPKAILALQKLTSINLSEIPYYTFTHGEFAGEKDVIISNTGYTGAGGFELYFYPEAAMKIWDAVFEAGAEYGIKPVGLGARDTLRLEMGFCLYGNDLDDTTSPIEAGLGWITKFVEGKNFINRPALEKQKAEGTVRKLVGFEMVDRGIPRHGYALFAPDGTEIGVVTSGTMSPTRKIGIGMGYVKPEYSKVGTEITIDMRGRKLKAIVVKPPFRK